MKPKHRNRRLALIGVGAIMLAGAAFLVFSALEENVSYFYTPSGAAEAGVAPDTRIRLGGMVEEGSIKEGPGLEIRFRMTDASHSVNVFFSGQRPDLFREGQAAVAQGRFTESGEFHADLILAKHDENYIPPELVDVMKEAKQPKQY